MKNLWVPLSCKNDVVEILIDDPKNLKKRNQIRKIMKTDKIKFSVGTKEHIEEFIKRFYCEIETVQVLSDNKQNMESGSMSDVLLEDDTKDSKETIGDKNNDKLSFQFVQPTDNTIKIINEKVIKKKEREFISAIKTELDWGMIKNLFIEEYLARISNFVNCEQGNIVVYNNCVAYKLDFKIKMPFSIMIDRGGDFLKIAPSA